MVPVSSSGISISELAAKSDIPENKLIHILRQLTSTNIFREPRPRYFAHTTFSALLVSPALPNLPDILLHFSDEGFKIAAYLPEALRLYGHNLDKVQKAELRTAFNLAFRTDQHFFDYIYTPENISTYGDRFGRAMMGGTFLESVNTVLRTYDWNQFEAGDKIVDVGGGVGYIGVAISKRVKPGVEVLVQDRPSVVEQGKSIFGESVTFQGHDFFNPQPVYGAKVYYLRLILHDWPDAVCITILGHIRKAMAEDSKLLIF